ncbi:hypothetical protein D3C87_1663760 [compost metagenome]
MAGFYKRYELLFVYTKFNTLELANANIFTALCDLVFDATFDSHTIIEDVCLAHKHLVGKVLFELTFNDLLTHIFRFFLKVFARKQFLLNALNFFSWNIFL